ncbi:DUF1624 domain-containing protein [Arthrobacter mangrovi]|uniref:Heparan-alpha-glucosaminide N-acetyltransferase catalytic domain-containing protein n=1 Tax=Arthrobacter mangrovi TaxID=2966350 RepID=A0ABQ5MPC3_9MICC|nr:DUF1624 domain-containing protein [Arthrobacter mangrovi]GLB65833.1 hypothetical protein AHIS1636_02720 [Arthrobacter mangrovi]
MSLSAPLPTAVSAKPRLAGVDAARGVALVGMIAVHVFSFYLPETDSVSWLVPVFSGRAAALFAVMAGVGLALTSGGRHRRSGEQAAADRRGIAVRAGVIAAVGLTLGQVEVDIAVILVFYALLFILALPLIRVEPRKLAVLTAAWIVLAPPIAYLARQALYAAPFLVVLPGDPNWTSAQDPVALLSTLFFTGTYPAFQWLGYLLLGMLLGRLGLGSPRIRLWLVLAGAAAVAAAQLASAFLLQVLGGAKALLATGEIDPWYFQAWDHRLLIDLSEVDEGTSGWWLALDTPHSGTSLDLLNTMGSAALVLGLCLLLGGTGDGPRGGGSRPLPVLAGPGSMTLSLYTAHVLVMGAVYASGAEVGEAALFWSQMVVFTGAGIAYKLASRRGPLEHLTAGAVRTVRRGADRSARPAA